MDQPALDVTEHKHALEGLHRLNLASGICRQLWRQIALLSLNLGHKRLRVLDVASGGGDVALGLWKLACQNGVNLEILGLDISATACAFAQTRCKPAGEAIAFQQVDVINGALPIGFDVVTCSLFLHHLSTEQATQLLTNMAAAGRLLVVSDLRRCATGYALAQLACRVLTRSPIVRYDGPQSVINAFSLSEMRALCGAAGLANAKVQSAWPCRLLVTHEGR